MVVEGVQSFGSTLCTRTKYGATIEEIFGVILVAKHDAKKEEICTIDPHIENLVRSMSRITKGNMST